ncbi:MAG: hypothetical protein IPL83_11595 [Bdellovibrionales bacterium]|nr:hypothetical protein [Bdellovibrionales bacterium]
MERKTARRRRLQQIHTIQVVQIALLMEPSLGPHSVSMEEHWLITVLSLALHLLDRLVPQDFPVIVVRSPAIGIMSVRVSSQYCPMPIGVYQVATTANGQWDSSLGGFRGLSLEARHTDGTIVRLRFDYGIIRGVQPNLVDDGVAFILVVSWLTLLLTRLCVACVVGYPGYPPLNKFFFTY